MQRWHSETALMEARMKFARADHNRWRDLPRSKLCACRRCTSDGIGWFRDRHPRDCGRARCGCCHGEKAYGPKRRGATKRRAVEFELSL